MTRLKQKKELSGDKQDVRFGTPQPVAHYRAIRLKAHANTIIEVGAGVGFQTKEFAKIAKVIAVEIDESKLSRANFPPNVVPIVGDALDPKVIEHVKKESSGKIIVFLDPERPPSSDRRTIEELKPNILEFVNIYSKISPHIVIELPPFLSDIPFSCEREFVSIDGVLNRLTVYLGDLKKSDISVVRLPQGNRFEHNGDIPEMKGSHVQEKYVLDPDGALVRAGIPHLPLNMPYKLENIGNKDVFITGQPGNEFYTSYKILAQGEATVTHSIPRLDCAGIILHGSMNQDKQKQLLKGLNNLCRGKQRLHLFLGSQWYLAKKKQ